MCEIDSYGDIETVALDIRISSPAPTSLEAALTLAGADTCTACHSSQVNCHGRAWNYRGSAVQVDNSTVYQNPC